MEVLKNLMLDKFKMRGKLLLAVFPILCMFILLTACSSDKDSLVVFKEDTYNYRLVYSLAREDYEDTAVVTLYEALEDACGVAPELVVDTDEEPTEDAKEIIIGTTNREGSALPELNETDCYWGLIVNENQIMVKGSNEYMIGLAVDHLMNNWKEITSDEKKSLLVAKDLTKEEKMEDYYREGWLLNTIPAYQGENTLSTAVYATGNYLTEFGDRNASANDMQGIWTTNEEEVTAYTEILEKHGYQEESHTSIEKNQFYRFVKGNQRIYLNYYGNAQRATVELDTSGRASISEVSYTYEPKAGEETQYYLFGIKMDTYGYSQKKEENTTGYIDNGAAMIVKCADNSIIYIDGGASSQMVDSDRERLYNFLLEITGKNKGEKITISAWYITHFDSDHCEGFASVLQANPERYDLQRVVCNLPDLEATSKTDATSIVMSNNAVTGAYPQCQDIKLRTGDVLQLADVTITTVFTHTDYADADARFATTNYNTTSTVAMFSSSAGMDMLVTGDMVSMSENILCENFSKETLKADILQQPHHNRTDVSTIYEYADAQVMFFTQTVGALTSNTTDTARSTLAKQWCSEWYCGGSETVGFNYSGNKANLILQRQDIYN